LEFHAEVFEMTELSSVLADEVETFFGTEFLLFLNGNIFRIVWNIFGLNESRLRK
jgi:hypothetical protein